MKRRTLRSKTINIWEVNRFSNRNIFLYLLLSICSFSSCEWDPRPPAKPRRGEVLVDEQLAEVEKKSKELEHKVDDACARYEKNKKDPQTIAELQKHVRDITDPVIAKKDELKAKLEEAKTDPQKATNYFFGLSNDLKTLEKVPPTLEVEINGKKGTKEELMKQHKDTIAKVYDLKNQFEKHSIKELSLFL